MLIRGIVVFSQGVGVCAVDFEVNQHHGVVWRGYCITRTQLQRKKGKKKPV